MKTTRFGTFETNSSSTHVLIICTEKEYNEFLKGELLVDYNDKLIPANSGGSGEDFREFGDRDWAESFEEHFETPSGDKMVAFGYHGYNG